MVGAVVEKGGNFRAKDEKDVLALLTLLAVHHL